jgi:hypothetical protein
MSYIGGGVGNSVTGTSFNVLHSVGGVRTGWRTVLVILTPSTFTITNIYNVGGVVDGGFTLRATYTAQGQTMRLYDKICLVTEPNGYTVTFTPTATSPGPKVIGFMADFATAGDAISAYGFADDDVTNGTTLTLPSIAATSGDDIYTLVWDNPDTSSGQLRPQSPLRTGPNAALSAGLTVYMEESREIWASSSPTGTRQYAVPSGTYLAAVGVIMLIGGTPITGGWGVGMVRMGAN